MVRVRKLHNELRIRNLHSAARVGSLHNVVRARSVHTMTGMRNLHDTGVEIVLCRRRGVKRKEKVRGFFVSACHNLYSHPPHPQEYLDPW
jgi:hypothetical protein